MKENGRWYGSDGFPVLSVPNKSQGGIPRRTTLSDAKKLGLYPSTTTILKSWFAPELERWKFQQIINASLTLPRNPQESDDDYASRIIEDAFKEVEDAADHGKAVHQAVELYFQGKPHDRKYNKQVDAVRKWKEENKVTFLKHELRIVDPIKRYAGTTDLLISVEGREGNGILDLKNRRTNPGMRVTSRTTEPLQIASYAVPLEASYGVNLYVSSTEDSRVEAVWYEPKQIQDAYAAFHHILSAWQILNNFPCKQ